MLDFNKIIISSENCPQMSLNWNKYNHNYQISNNEATTMKLTVPQTQIRSLRLILKLTQYYLACMQRRSQSLHKQAPGGV